MAGFWTGLPVGRVVRLTGASPEAIERAVDPLPAGAPAMVLCQPAADPSAARAATALLDRIEVAALDLFPAWLASAESITPTGVTELRAVASRLAADTPRLVPFLADLAERSQGGVPDGPSRFPSEVRAAGLARVVAGGYRRGQVALLLRRPDEIDALVEDALLTACGWLADRGGFSVWLTGAGWHTRDRLLMVGVHVAGRAGAAARSPRSAATVVRLPAAAGEPHPARRSERALEAALVEQPWAVGRAWNRTYQADPSDDPIRVDLMWAEERVAVEFEGDDHRAPGHMNGRGRELARQLTGFEILRCTDAQITHELPAVLTRLERTVTGRRG